VSRRPLVLDALGAVLIVALVLIIEPGVAVAAILAAILFLLCGVGFLLGHRPRRRPRRVGPRR
jgi:hypothetical protein